MSEEEIMQGINRTIAFMKEELKTEHSCFSIQELWALQGLLDLYNKEKALAENHRIAFEKQTENLHEMECLYNKEKAKNKELYTQEDINKEHELGYGQGVYYTTEYWKDKIKKKFEDYSQSSLMENNTFLDFKNDLLEEVNK